MENSFLAREANMVSMIDTSYIKNMRRCALNQINLALTGNHL